MSMSAAAVTAAYRKSLGETVLVRRYTGTGQNRPRFDVAALARVVGYAPHELVGTIQQGDRKAIVLVEDLIKAGFALPITSADKLVVGGRELQIVAPDGETRKVDGVLIAYELQVRG